MEELYGHWETSISCVLTDTITSFVVSYLESKNCSSMAPAVTPPVSQVSRMSCVIKQLVSLKADSFLRRSS